MAANFGTVKRSPASLKSREWMKKLQRKALWLPAKKPMFWCSVAGGGTSGLLANALNKATAEYNVLSRQQRGGYGAHTVKCCLSLTLVIMPPPELPLTLRIWRRSDRGRGIKLAKTEGAQYIKLTHDGKGSTGLHSGAIQQLNLFI